jgi:glutamate-1-semialdehyde 2,1-aminomutase
LLESMLAGGALHVQRVGSIFWVPGVRGPREVMRSPEAMGAEDTAAYPRLFHALLDRGIYLPPSPLEVGFLATAHDEQHIHELAEALIAGAR